jgi:alpha-glucosidase (family GH31 glycosyl hydrolase)
MRVSNGNPVLPPKWAFGVLWGTYYDQIGSESAKGGKLVDAAQWLRCSQYGGDLLWIDSSWLYHDYTSAASGPHYVCFDAPAGLPGFDPVTFPDPKTMIQAVQQMHFHFGLWQWPWMSSMCDEYDYGVANSLFVMSGATPAPATKTATVSGPWHGDTKPAEFDFTNPAAVDWWKSLNKDLVGAGLDVLKLDTTAAQQRLPIDNGGQFMDSSKDITREYHQAGFDLTKAYGEANYPEAQMNGGRGFILVHGDNTPGNPLGSANNDQTPGMWTGDTISDWRGFDCYGCAPPDAGGSVETAQGNSDIERAHRMNTADTAAYWGGDTGGYDTVPVDELYQRWLEYSTFTPLQEFFNAKSDGLGAKFPWLYSQASQAIALTYNQLRYQLLPFRYSNAQATYQLPSSRTTQGGPPVHYPVTWQGDFMILSGDGDSQILVQPVTTPGATTAAVNLPPGDWILYWNGTSYSSTCPAPAIEGDAAGADASTDAAAATDASGADDGGAGDGGGTGSGGCAATVPAKADQIPFLIKTGSIIPWGPLIHYVGERPADPLTLDTYPSGAATSYNLYEDDGISEGYMGGAYSTTRFAVDGTGGHVKMTIGAQATAKYKYAGQLLARTYVLKINLQSAPPMAITRDGQAVTMSSADGFAAAGEGWYYDATAKTVWVKFRLDSSASTTVVLQ